MIFFEKRDELFQHVLFAVTLFDSGARHHDHADGNRAAMTNGKIACRFDGVTERVAKVQRPARAGVKFIFLDHVALHRDAELENVLKLLARGRFVEVFEERMALEHRGLDDLRAAIVENGVGEGRQNVRVTEDQGWLAERADEVLARRKINRRLSADGGIDLRQKRCRNLDKANPAKIRRRQMGAYMPQSGTAGLRYEAKIFDLLSALLEWNDLTLSTPAVACISAKDQEALQSLKHFLRQNYSAQVDLPRLAQMCYMSKSKLTYLFRMLYGTTIYEFVLACRIDRAKELLADQEKKISEIATLVGYERQSSFSAAFHQRTGITPNEFRRQLGN